MTYFYRRTARLLTLPSFVIFLLAAGCTRPEPDTTAANSAPASSAPAAPGGGSTTTAAAATTAADTAPKTGTDTAVAPPAPAKKPAEPVRGIYVSGWIAGGTTRWNQLVTMVNKTEINAIVIDVKEDGMLSYDVENALAREVGANHKMIPDIDAKMAQLKKHDIFPIARITVFRDRVTARKRPDLAVQRTDGSPWRDRSGHLWLDPYNQANWDYNVEVAIDAAKRGFREIQWDYVRFPSEGARTGRHYPAKAKDDQRSEARVIANFLEYAREKLRPYDVAVSADIFGLTLSAAEDDDMGIGQKMGLMTPHLDVVCPMVYPSHYNRGEYGISYPNAAPYQTVFRALSDGNKRLKGSKCGMRPWLQDFSLGVRYGERQVREQIRAARDNGVQEYLLWNASNRYTFSALTPPKPKKTKTAKKAATKTVKADEKTTPKKPEDEKPKSAPKAAEQPAATKP